MLDSSGGRLAEEVGVTLCECVSKSYEEQAYPRGIISDDTAGSRESIMAEWFYLDAFLIDYSAFQALGNTPKKAALLDVFWISIRRWLGEKEVTALPERVWLIGGKLQTIEAEPIETAFLRLRRRAAIYMEALKTPHQYGPNYNVGLTFACLCGTTDIASVLGVAEFCAEKQTGLVRMLNSLQVGDLEI